MSQILQTEASGAISLVLEKSMYDLQKKKNELLHYFQKNRQNSLKYIHKMGFRSIFSVIN